MDKNNRYILTIKIFCAYCWINHYRNIKKNIMLITKTVNLVVAWTLHWVVV